MKLYDPIVFVVTIAALLALFVAAPLALDNELGLIGLFTGLFTLLLAVIEGGPGPLTKAMAALALIIVLGYLFYEWYSTSTLFI